MTAPLQVSYCTTVKDRGASLVRLAGFLADLHDDDFELIVADFKSSDANLVEELAQFDYPIKVVSLGGFFNRSRGLNQAAAASTGRDRDLLFFIDVDMYVTPDFNDRVRGHVKPGQCWFPICYSLHKDKPCEVYKNTKKPAAGNGWWRKEGHGMCGFTVANFRDKVRWNEEIGRTYGKEDGDMARQAKVAGLNRIRENCDGLFHIWHPKSRSVYEGRKTPTKGVTRLNTKRTPRKSARRPARKRK